MGIADMGIYWHLWYFETKKYFIVVIFNRNYVKCS